MRRRLEVLGRHSSVRVPSLINLNPDEMLRLSYKRKAFLARYGRQSMLQWDDVETVEIDRLARAVAELLKEENELAKAVEDG